MQVTKKRLRQLIREMAFDPEKDMGVFKPPESLRRNWYTRRVAADKSRVRGGAFDPVYNKEFDDLTFDDFVKVYDRDHRRALGLLTHAEAEEEKAILRKYHSENSDEIKKFKAELFKPIEQSRISCLHGIEYSGAYSDKGATSVKEWVSKYGMRGRSQLSTCMYPVPVHRIGYDIGEMEDNAGEVFGGVSMILQGFPVIMNYEDFMSQTSTALPQKLVDFQKGSGISKSIGAEPNIKNLDEFISKNVAAEEVIISNWGVKGAHASFHCCLIDPGGNYNEGYQPDSYYHRLHDSLLKDCSELNIPLYVTYFDDSFFTFDVRRHTSQGVVSLGDKRKAKKEVEEVDRDEILRRLRDVFK